MNANQGWVVGSSGRIYVTTDGGATWTIQNTTTALDLNKIHFIDTQHGWACGNGPGGWYLVIRTTDGGALWQDVSFGYDNGNLTDIYFVDSLNGWICGYDNGGTDGTIHHTTDGGLSWTGQTLPPDIGRISAIDFPTANKGWATESNQYTATPGAILHTTDAGTNWTIQGYTDFDYNWCIDCQDTLHIAVSSCNVWPPTKPRVVVSNDGGNTWSSYEHLFNAYTRGVQYIGDNIWTTSDAGQIILSTDNGVSWQWNYNAAGWQGISWRDSSNGYLIKETDLGYDGYALRSTDAGFTWFYDPNTPGGSEIQFIDANQGWILEKGDSSGVYRTTNGGTSWVYNSFGTGERIGSMFFATQDSGWACGSNGTILVTSDGGASWSAQSPGVSVPFTAVYFVNSQEGWACGYHRDGFLVHTTNGGANWTAQPSAPFKVICFPSQNLGLLGTGRGATVHRTTDGGNTWSVGQSFPQWSIEDIAMKDTLEGWLIACNRGDQGNDGRGFIYKTTDGGVTWTLSYSTPRIHSSLQDIAHHYDDVFWVCGNHSIILKYVPPSGVVEHNAGIRESIRFHITPNLFTSETAVKFSLDKSESVNITVYNALGRRVIEICNSTIGAGNHEMFWNGKDENGFACATGLYICVARAGDHTETYKLMLLK